MGSFNKNRSHQLVLIFKEPPTAAMARAMAVEPGSIESKMQDIFQQENLFAKPLFPSISEGAMALKEFILDDRHERQLQEMGKFYHLRSESKDQLEKVKHRLEDLGVLSGAYYKPQSEPPAFFREKGHAGSLKKQGKTLKLTGDLSAKQVYLNPAPAGIDTAAAWALPGGRGADVNIIDIEGGWNFNHEDLQDNSRRLLSGINNTGDPDWFDHGTAVLGEMGGDANGKGVMGICPDAVIATVSVYANEKMDFDTAGAIHFAADSLAPGDIIIIEQHRPGPNSPNADTQFGYIPIEWWPDDYLAILYATSKGIIVIEAAGNGAQDLDAAIYSQRPTNFPESWSNPFVRSEDRDSGAVLVGAGAPPPGTHGQDWGTDRSRLDFSNYGTCVDTQGWGEGVTTCGYGDIHGEDPQDIKEWYTDSFAGTSSATPIVTGAVACLQGIRKAGGNPPLRPDQVRELLQKTGSPQQESSAAPVSQRIGPRPDMKQLIKAISF